MRRYFLPALWVWLVLAVAGPVLAADAPKVKRPVRLSIRSIMPRARSQSPQTIEISLDCDSEKLFEGRLELKFYLGKRLVHDYLSQPLAVTAGGQRLRVIVPPIMVHSEKTPVTAYARFVSPRQVIDLGEVDLVVPVVSKRAFVVAVVQPQELLLSPTERGMSEALGLERFNPLPDTHFDMLTYPARLTPEELPAVAAGYASFDLLLLEREGFQKLRGAQLSAILSWVTAGGSLVVDPRATLTAGHVDFLNRLAGPATVDGGDSQNALAAYALDEKGQLAIGERALAAGQALARFHAGLGRAVVVHEALEPVLDFDSAEWKATVAFLWKIRARQTEAIANTGYWDFTRPQTPPHLSPLARRLFAPQRDDLAQSARQLLMPARIEGVPLKVVVVILSLFLLAIAPGDYYLLGRLKCRRYTWWLFLFISASFTLGTVKIAEHYMGNSDYRTSLTFVDVGQAGLEAGSRASVARTSRFELLFVATQRKIETALKDRLHADLTHGAELEEKIKKETRPSMHPEDDELDLLDAVSIDLPTYEGALPASFTVHQQLRQWSPRITRETSLVDDPALLAECDIDWNAIRPDEWHSAAGRQSLFDAILAREPEADLLLLNRNWGFAPLHNADAPPPTAAPSFVNIQPNRQAVIATRTFPQPASVSSPAAVPRAAFESASPVVSLARKFSVRSDTGLFTIVSQVSPTGGENLEDMALLDETDPGQWLLIVALRREAGWIVYRKLFHRASSLGGP